MSESPLITRLRASLTPGHAPSAPLVNEAITRLTAFETFLALYLTEDQGCPCDVCKMARSLAHKDIVLPDVPDYPEVQQLQVQFADHIGNALPPGWGFSLFLFQYAPSDALFYISNCQRGCHDRPPRMAHPATLTKG